MQNKSETNAKPFVKNEILGTQITNATASDILKYVIEFAKAEKGKLQIVTPNPEIVVYATKHSKFQSLLNQAQISLPDGVGILLAGLLLGQSFKERITGIDFMEQICQICAQHPIKVGFLGAQPGIAQKAADCLIKKYPGLQVGFAMSELSTDGNRKLDIGNSKISKTKELLPITSDLFPKVDILFVAFGFPKQEEWIAENLAHLPVTVAMGVGGAFDYISGTVDRAPYLIRATGFEWLYRLVRQPWRWKRQIALIEFIWLVLRDKFSILPQILNS